MDHWKSVNLSSDSFYGLEEHERKNVLENLHHYVHEDKMGNDDYGNFLIAINHIKDQLFLNDNAMRFLAIKKLAELEDGR